MSVRLHRTVRFSVSAAAQHAPDAADPESHADANGFGGVPSMRGLGAHYELTVACSGPPDPQSGYLINIKDIDRAVRDAAIPAIQHLFATAPATEPAAALPEIAAEVAARLEPMTESVRWHLSPTYSVESIMAETSRVILRQRFDFAASHRLHVAGLSDEDNRRLFGKCNNPSGHGHNYVVEPAVAIEPSADTPFSLQDLETLTDELVIDRFDHTHLNVDTEEFGEAGANPSVEHIARVCFERLKGAVAERGGELRTVTVWETDRTSCTYPAG